MVAILQDRQVQDQLEALSSQTRTPTLCFDGNGIQNLMNQVSKIGRRHKIQFLFPVKAFPHHQMWQMAAKALEGFDVSNLSELKQVQNFKARIYSLDWKCQEISRTLFNYLTEAKGSQYFISSESESVLRENVGQHRLRMGLRIDPQSVLPGRLQHKDISKSRFGFAGQAAVELLRATNARSAGLHFHYGSEQNTSGHYLSMAKAALQIAKQGGVRLDFLNLGGGLAHFNLVELEKLLKDIRRIIQRDIPVILEPGRFFSERFGYALGRVKSVQIGQDLQVRLNLSKECHLRWGRPQLILPKSGLHRQEFQNFRLAGPSAIESDVILDFTMNGATPEFKVGDPIILKNIAGYCVAWNQSFNGIPKAKIQFF